MADKVTQDQAIKNGFVFQGSQYEGGVVNGLEYINSYGGSVLDPDDASKVVIDSPDSVQRLETAASIVGDGISPQALTNYTETESQSVFLNGDSVFLRGWPYMYSLAGNPEEADIEQNQIGIASMPAGSAGSVSGLGGWNVYIDASSDAQDAAYAFIEFAPAPEQQKYRAMEGAFLLTLKNLYEDKEIVDAVPVVELAPQALANTVPRPISAYYSDMSLEMSEQFSQVYKCDVSPEDAVKLVQESLQQIAEAAS